MARRYLVTIVVLTAAIALEVVASSGVAQARPIHNNPILHGTVTCTNNWSGTIKFTPPLKTGAAGHVETFTVAAALGSTANPCMVVQTGGAEIGAIGGKIKFAAAAGANNCANVFSGIALPAPTSAAFVLPWTTPAGAPTKWKQPAPVTVTGTAAATSIAISGGTVAGSFAPLAAPAATLADTPSPKWGAAALAACGTLAGLASLPLGVGSTGTW